MNFLKKILHHGPDVAVRPAHPTVNGKVWLDFLIHVEIIGDVRANDDDHLLSFPALRVEGFQINSSLPDLEIKYMAHVQSEGDTEWKKVGQFVGTKGKSRRLEGIAVKLEGNAAANYVVKYYVHMDGIRQSPIKSDGQFAGTRGESRRIEGIAVWLEPKQTQVEELVEYNQAENMDIERQYTIRCHRNSDIYEHLPTLYHYAKQCTQIAEFGVRSVVSTWAMIRGLRDSEGSNKKLICVDLERSRDIDEAIKAAQDSNIIYIVSIYYIIYQ